MNKITTELPVIKLVGISARTSNSAEMNQATARIPATMRQFFMDGLQTKIPDRTNPGRVFAVYTNYESDEHGYYTYFLGEEVKSFQNIEQGFETLTIPKQDYIRFTSNSGQMPHVVIDMWQNIWKMDISELGAKRAYIADFEIYDERSRDQNNAVVDIYIGTQK